MTGLDYNNLSVESRVNGEIRQSGRTSELIFPVDTIISYISQFVTLMPGDVIYTGTPGTTKPMHPGEVIEIEVEGVGVLRNPVAYSVPLRTNVDSTEPSPRSASAIARSLKVEST